MTIRGSGDSLVLMMLRSKEANLLINWGRGDARTQDNEDVGWEFKVEQSLTFAEALARPDWPDEFMVEGKFRCLDKIIEWISKELSQVGRWMMMVRMLSDGPNRKADEFYDVPSDFLQTLDFIPSIITHNHSQAQGNSYHTLSLRVRDRCPRPEARGPQLRRRRWFRHVKGNHASFEN